MEISTTRLSSGGQIVISVEMRSHLREGDNLGIIRKGEELVIKKEKEALMNLVDSNLLAED
jgi:bifunctional DNA-binding transcriptional regulator/antitoxin component of YhaV-PrlF toxin-antitoxin module